jgi:hypothetical protein
VCGRIIERIMAFVVIFGSTRVEVPVTDHFLRGAQNRSLLRGAQTWTSIRQCKFIPKCRKIEIRRTAIFIGNSIVQIDNIVVNFLSHKLVRTCCQCL